MPEYVIIRNVTYEFRCPVEGLSPPTVELHEMTVVNDSGPQIFIEKEKQAA